MHSRDEAISSVACFLSSNLYEIAHMDKLASFKVSVGQMIPLLESPIDELFSLSVR